MLTDEKESEAYPLQELDTERPLENKDTTSARERAVHYSPQRRRYNTDGLPPGSKPEDFPPLYTEHANPARERLMGQLTTLHKQTIENAAKQLAEDAEFGSQGSLSAEELRDYLTALQQFEEGEIDLFLSQKPDATPAEIQKAFEPSSFVTRLISGLLAEKKVLLYDASESAGLPPEDQNNTLNRLYQVQNALCATERLFKPQFKEANARQNT